MKVMVVVVMKNNVKIRTLHNNLFSKNAVKYVVGVM
jgi:hypothetical protein